MKSSANKAMITKVFEDQMMQVPKPGCESAGFHAAAFECGFGQGRIGGIDYRIETTDGTSVICDGVTEHQQPRGVPVFRYEIAHCLHQTGIPKCTFRNIETRISTAYIGADLVEEIACLTQAADEVLHLR